MIVMAMFPTRAVDGLENVRPFKDGCFVHLSMFLFGGVSLRDRFRGSLLLVPTSLEMVRVEEI